MKTSIHFTVALVTIIAVQVQAGYIRNMRGVKAFSVYRTNDWNNDGTVKYEGVDVDTTVGWIDHTTGQFGAPDTGVYRFTFTAQIFCPARSDCNGDIMLKTTDDEIIASSHEVT